MITPEAAHYAWKVTVIRTPEVKWRLWDEDGVRMCASQVDKACTPYL